MKQMKSMASTRYAIEDHRKVMVWIGLVILVMWVLFGGDGMGTSYVMGAVETAEPIDHDLMPMDLHIESGMHPVVVIGLIVAGTFVLEDLACIAVGMLIARGEMHWLVGGVGCFIGIYLGDLLLWMLGRFGLKRFLNRPWVAKRMPMARLNRFGEWFDQRGWLAVVASRFIPGTRLPLYLAVGMFGKNPVRFFVWTLLAVMIWVPVILGLVSMFGARIVGPLEKILGVEWLALVAAALLLLFGLQVIERLFTQRGRLELWVRLSKIWQPEFWPPVVFYTPLVPYLVWLSLRYRGITVWTAGNPGIPNGGVVGESKHDILMKLARDMVVPSALLSKDELSMDRLQALMQERAWSYPLIVKPNCAQRGFGLKKVEDDHQARAYLSQARFDVLVQPYDVGPYECGVFYWRDPQTHKSRIFSVTDKRFPQVIGDGRRTVEQLIWQDPRLRMQANVFTTRYADSLNTVLAKNQTMMLAVAGNHCQGALFRNGSHLISPEMIRALDRAVAKFDGFNIGRFDIRYTDPASLRRGEKIRIVELNGVTSESTNIYDPGRSLFWSYRVLFAQWRLLYRIGAMCRAQGAKPIGVWSLLQLLRSYYRDRQINPISD